MTTEKHEPILTAQAQIRKQIDDKYNKLLSDIRAVLYNTMLAEYEQRGVDRDE